MDEYKKKAAKDELVSIRKASSSPIADIFRSMRPHQWTKNLLVLVAYFFAYWDQGQVLKPEALAQSVTATVIFCIVSSAIYIMNDVRDISSDRLHSVKKNRPIASGRIPASAATSLSLLLIFVGFSAAAALSRPFSLVVVSYVVLQVLYSFALKHVAVVDIILIAAGFVLRAIAGAVVINVVISPWLLLCTFLLSLFIALCKRRSEKDMGHTVDHGQRASLEKYDVKLLDQMLAVTSGATIVAYSIYTLDHNTVAKFGTSRLGFTIPFVIFGIFRYLDLVYRHCKGERPEMILLTDLPTIINLILYGIAMVVIFSI